MATTSINMTGVINSYEAVKVRDKASINGRIVDYVYDETEILFTKNKGKWYYTEEYSGWIEEEYIKFDINNQVSQMTKEDMDKKIKKDNKIQKELEQQMKELDIYTSEKSVSNTTITNGFLGNNNGIYGIPYQFMQSVDPRIGESEMGRKYVEKIVSKIPLLCITPGKIKFMSNFSKDEQKGILAKLLTGDRDTDISDIIKKNGRYFTFAFAYKDYFDYVNSLCRIGAKFLNIQNVEIRVGDTKAKAKNFNWSKALNKNLKASLTSQEFIGFYIDSSATDSVSEEFSNTTGESQLASTVNGFSDLGREIGFLMGAGAGKTIDLIDPNKETEVNAAIEEVAGKYLNGSSLLTNIAKNFHTVASGGKLLFPEIWQDSSFSKSYDISIKLRTPDADTLSWYLNIYVPLCHLIALVAGHQTDNANGYYSPFLIRAFYKGLFNVDMGIVTSMSISKGKKASWNVDGLPTEVDINMSIKDLYNMMSIVPGNEPKNFVNNNILMDYIANTCGININQMDIGRSLEIYWILQTDRVIDLPNNTMRKLQDAVDTFSQNSTLGKFLF